jgi:hypothetical protein
MKKYGLIIYKVVIATIFIIAIVFASLTFSKKDELITENITLKYFEKSMNNFDKDELKEFVANSENDILYKNAVKNFEIYHHDTVAEYSFTIDEYEVFGNGKYQCYFNLKKVPTCDVEHEGKYMNYLVNTTTEDKTPSGDTFEVKEKGLVVFVKDGSNGNIFEWKLVRYDRESNI